MNKDIQVIGIDVDGVLANFTASYGRSIVEHIGEDKLPDGWHQDPDFPKTWNWELDAGYTAEQVKAVWDSKILRSSTFWMDLAPMEDAKDSLKQLNSLAKAGKEVVFITHRMGKKAKRQTEQWLYSHGIDYPTVILSGNKLAVIRTIGADFYIDDKLSTMAEIHRHCQDLTITLKDHAYLKHAPYNTAARPAGLKTAVSLSDALKQSGLWKESKAKNDR